MQIHDLIARTFSGDLLCIAFCDHEVELMNTKKYRVLLQYEHLATDRERDREKRISIKF